MMKLLVEVKLNNSNIPNDPRQNQIIKMTQYGLCPTVPRSPLYRDDAFLLRCMSCANLILGTNIAYYVLKFYYGRVSAYVLKENFWSFCGYDQTTPL